MSLAREFEEKTMRHGKWIAGLLCFGIITGLATTAFGGIKEVEAREKNRIVPITREVGSGTRSAFVELTDLETLNLFGELEDGTAESVKEVKSSEEMMRNVALIEEGLGYVSYAIAKDFQNVKILEVDGVELSQDTITNESYPLIRPFQLVYRGEMTELQKDFLQYVKSKGQGLIGDYCESVRNEGIFLPRHPAGTLTISGSTSMTPMLEVLAENYMKENEKATVEVQSSDSEAGMMNVVAGKSDFGMVSRELKKYEENVVTAECIGRDGIAVIVNPDNMLNDISVSQIKKVYNREITSWEYMDVYQ